MGLDQKKLSSYWYFLVLIFVGLGVIVVWANYRFAQNNPGGNDYLPRWLGTRLFMFEGISPYSEETGLAIQQSIFGRPAEPGEDKSLFVYPFYSTLLFSPFSLISDYTLSRALWMAFLEISLILIAIYSRKLVTWNISAWLLPIYFIFSLFWYHGLRATINGNVVIVVTLLIVLLMDAIQKDNDIVAGLLLAYSTIKPNLVILFVIIVLIWAASRRRWGLVRWFLIWLILLIVVGLFFIPNWPLQNIQAIIHYPEYTTVSTLGSVLIDWLPGIGNQLNWGLSIILVILTLFEWWSAWGKGFTHFLWTACFTLTVSQWIGITTDPGNFIILFLPLALIFSVVKERWPKWGNWLNLGLMILLFASIWGLFLRSVEYGNQPQQHPIMFVPMPLFTLIGLYWARWWFIRPNRRMINSSITH